MNTRTIVYEFYARDRCDPSLRSGSWALRALLQSFADNKLIEDVHQPLRLDARANVHRRLSPLHIQDVVLESQALECRGIPHPGRVTKEYWCQNLLGALRPEKARRVSHNAYRRRLPNKLSTIVKPGDKTRATLDETTLQKAGAAWHWLHEYMDYKSGRGHGLPQGTNIADAMMSKFVPPCGILKHRPEHMVVASLGNKTWSVLGLPLCQIHSEDDGPDVVYYSFEPRGEVNWLHIVKANDWVVVPHVAHRCAAHGVVLKMSGAEQPLPKHILQTKNKSLLTGDDLHRLQKHLRLSTESSPIPKNRLAH